MSADGGYDDQPHVQEIRPMTLAYDVPVDPMDLLQCDSCQ